MNTFSRFKKIPSTVISRNINSNSTLKVAVGDTVSPSDIIAEIKPSAGFHILELSTALGISAANAAKYAVRKEGEKVYKGEIIAERAKMLTKEMVRATAPIDGIIQHINSKNGQVLIKMTRKQEYIPSGVWGTIVKTEKNQRIDIQTQVLQINGKAGRGYERSGSLKIICNQYETIREYMIKEELAGKIVVGGSTITREAIARCVNYGVVGIVTGGIEYSDLLSINQESDIGVSLVILEGFGTLSINDTTYKILTEYDNYYSFISGKENKLTVPLNSVDEKPEKNALPIIKVGSTVRIIFDGLIGQTSTVNEIIQEYTFPSGITTNAVKITSLNTEQIVPLANIEILL